MKLGTTNTFFTAKTKQPALKNPHDDYFLPIWLEIASQRIIKMTVLIVLGKN